MQTVKYTDQSNSNSWSAIGFVGSSLIGWLKIWTLTWPYTGCC